MSDNATHKLAVYFASIALATWLLQLMWNWQVVQITGFQTISFWQAFGLILTSGLFGVMSRAGKYLKEG